MGVFIAAVRVRARTSFAMPGGPGFVTIPSVLVKIFVVPEIFLIFPIALEIPAIAIQIFPASRTKRPTNVSVDFVRAQQPRLPLRTFKRYLVPFAAYSIEPV